MSVLPAIVGLLALSPRAEAQGASGFVELRGTWQAGVSGRPWQLVERFRPRFEAKFGERLLLSTTIEAGLVQGATGQRALQDALADSSLQPILDLANCEWPEPENSLFGISSASEYLAVDRLYLDWYHPKFDLRVGRQAVQWGSALFVNPTDPYPQVLVTQPWLPRAGVNSARITVPIGDLHQVQAIVGTDDTLTRFRGAVRGTVNVLQTDVSLISAYRQESDELLAGLDIKGTLGVGFWVEAALHLRELFDANEELAVSEEVAVGIDYSFPVLEQFVVAAQYYRNGAGGRGPEDYDLTGRLNQGVQPPDCDTDIFGTEAAAPVDPFAPFFAARNYGLLSLQMGFTREVSLSAAALQNFDDGTGFAIPTVSVTPFGSVQMSLSAQIPYRLYGDGGEFSSRDEDLQLEVPGLEPVDLSGLVPDASIILWTRANF